MERDDAVFQVDRVVTGSGSAVRCAGELDISTVPRLEELLLALDEDVLVDLSELTFLDSSGINALLVAADRLETRDRTLRVTGPQPQVLRVLEIAGVAERLVTGANA